MNTMKSRPHKQDQKDQQPKHQENQQQQTRQVPGPKKQSSSVLQNDQNLNEQERPETRMTR